MGGGGGYLAARARPRRRLSEASLTRLARLLLGAVEAASRSPSRRDPRATCQPTCSIDIPLPAPVPRKRTLTSAVSPNASVVSTSGRPVGEDAQHLVEELAHPGVPAVHLGLRLLDQRGELHVRVHQVEKAVEVAAGRVAANASRASSALSMSVTRLSMPS